MAGGTGANTNGVYELALRRSHAVSLSHGHRWSSRRFSRSSFCCPCVEEELVKVFANEHKKITCELSCKGDREKDRGRMKLEEMRELLGKNRIEDVSWLCSLSESELDMLISLKLLVLQRAKIIGHEDLANKFDLKMLRALGLIVMENIKGKVKDLSLIPALAEPALMDCCSLLKCNSKDIMSIEELKACLDIASRKRPAKSLRPLGSAARTPFVLAVQ
ncbi:hypothetical protein ACOSQ3_022428 [Xanthoceras sorbifolium]